MSRTRATINKIKFYSINRDVKAALANKTYNVQTIATKQRVSRETVRHIRIAGSWPKFVEQRKARTAKIVDQMRAKAVKGHVAPKPLVRKPLDSSAAHQAKELEQLRETITDQQLAIDNLTRRLDGQDTRANRIIDWLNAVDERTSKRWWKRGAK